MPDFTFIAVILIIFVVLSFFDTIFKSCMFFPYMRFLHDTGITVKPYGIVWETKRFNRTFQWLSHFRRGFLRSWFQIGAYVTKICMMPAFCLVSYSFWQCLSITQKVPDSKKDTPLVAESYSINDSTNDIINDSTNDIINDSNIDSPILIPIIPGVTLPLSQIFYYCGTLFLCVLIHEMGHAVAACRENITIDGCGIGLYGIFPLAYIKLPTEQLQNLLPAQRFRIFSAGIWHNIILSGFALLLMWTNFIILSPVFELGKGVSIVHVKPDSGLTLPSGFAVNDHIFKINDCVITNTQSWEDCLMKFHTNNKQGFCVSSDFIKSRDIAIRNKSVDTCCPDSNDHLCFQDMDTKEKFCLPGRKLAETTNICYGKEDCRGQVCLVAVFSISNSRLLRIERYYKASVMYIGTVSDLRYSVTVTSWTAKFRALSVLYVEMYETILIYIVTFSCGLVIMNLIPCYGLDGAHLIELIVHLYLLNIVKQYNHRTFIISLLNFLGLFLILVSLIYSIINFLN